MSKKISSYINNKLNSSDVTWRLSCDFERQIIIGEMITDINEIMEQNEQGFLWLQTRFVVLEKENSVSYRVR